MARVGRKAKATALRVVEGNLSKRPLPVGEPMPALIERLDPPEYLTNKAKELFMEKAPALAEIGLLTTADVNSFGMYCAIHVRWVEASSELERQINKYGISAYFITTGRHLIKKKKPKKKSKKKTKKRAVKSPNPEEPEIILREGTRVQNPLVAVVNKLHDQLVKLTAEFGLTPSSRTGIVGRKPALEKEKSTWDLL